MYYVYSLSYDGIVFYIGCTKHPFKRFKEHATGNDHCTSAVVYPNVLKGLMPSISILHHCNNRPEAFERERFLIKLYSKLNRRLTNKDYNTLNNTILGEIRSHSSNSERYKFDYTAVEFYINTYINNIV